MEKYTYETKPKLFKEQRDYIKKSSQLTILTWMTNEIALQNDILQEANILKLVELRMVCNQKNTGTSWEDVLQWITELKQNGTFK